MGTRSLLAPSDSAVGVPPTYLRIPVEGTGRDPPDEADDEAREEHINRLTDHIEGLTDCEHETFPIHRWVYWANGYAQGSILNAPGLTFIHLD